MQMLKDKQSAMRYRHENDISEEPRWRACDLKRRHQLTEERYQSMLRLQDNRCGICGLLAEIFPRRLSIDHKHHICAHDHKQSCDVCRRGLLCDRCNGALAFAEDVLLAIIRSKLVSLIELSDTRKRQIEYLIRYEQQTKLITL